MLSYLNLAVLDGLGTEPLALQVAPKSDLTAIPRQKISLPATDRSKPSKHQ